MFKKNKPMTTSTVSNLVPGATPEVEAAVEKVVKTDRSPSPDDVMVGGKLFTKENYVEDGCAKSRLVEVK